MTCAMLTGHHGPRITACIIRWRAQISTGPAHREPEAADAAALTLICEGPGCTTPADQCQVHHLTAWEHQGQTNVREMTMACAKHNGLNDDDPNAPPRNGRLERHPGGVVHIPPDGGPPRTNTHPLRDLSARGPRSDD